MKRPEFVSAAQAVDSIADDSTLCTIGMTLISASETILKEIEQRFLTQGHPRDLTYVHSCGQAAMKMPGGMSRLAHEGLIKRVIGGHWGQSPGMMDLISGNKIEAFNLPQGQMANLFHSMALREPGKLSKIGLGTYIDPRIEGGKMNQKTKDCGDDVVAIVTVDGEEYIQYKPIPIDTLVIRGTYCDENGNLSTDEEGMILEVLPAVMATKTIETEKDRRMTIMTTTFIPCSAKLPIIALMFGSMFGTEQAGWVAPLFYFLGVAAVIVSGIILKKTKMFAGDPAPFVMELPQYHIPSPRSVLIHMLERGKAFIIKAGTVIFVACGVVWFLSNFGWASGGATFGMLDMEDPVVNQMDFSILAYLGNAIAWIFAPLGFGNWQGAVATITGLVAKENVVSTFGVLFGLADAGETDPGLWTAVSTMLPTMGAKLSFLAFNLLCAPCFAAIGAIKREMASAKWTAFAIGYQCVFAYCVALMLYQFSLLFSGAGFTIGSAAAIIILALLLFLLFRPDPNRTAELRRRSAAANA